MGNFPCNLITGEKPMSARFYNPEYVSALCNLPGNEFKWNGEWVKNTVQKCDGYQIGGQYYNTRFELP